MRTFFLSLFLSFFAFLFSVKVFAENGKATWQPLAVEYDWVQLTSGEWLKGEMKAMYSEKLEFDSDKLDLLTIDWEDVKFLKSHRHSHVNLETMGQVTGQLEVSGDNIKMTNGDKVLEFDRIEIISFAPAGDREIDLWALKFTVSLNIRSGNTKQVDYAAQASAKRRTAKSRLSIDYLGNISKTDVSGGTFEETINNHRLNAGLDIYATRYFFYTPLTGEYYSDPFQNIDRRITLGVGVGYTFYDTAKLEWQINGGPAYISTRYISVLPGEDVKVTAPALTLGTDLDYEINSKTDFIFKYNLQASKAKVGGFTHHLIATIENELTGQLDLNVSFVWDRISQPTTDDTGNVPSPDDYRLLLGVSYSF